MSEPAVHPYTARPVKFVTFWRGELAAPWPAESGRLGMRRVVCGHRHRSPETAQRCADEWLEDQLFWMAHQDDVDAARREAAGPLMSRADLRQAIRGRRFRG